ncbi:MAG: cupin domain-containing protein [Bacteroidota bacterium]|nr:cupin domain-containing protein [Bacteroidota bacterium]
MKGLEIDDIISQGIADLYILGALPESDKASIEILMASNETLKEYIESTKKALERYSFTHRILPPNHFKTSVLNAVKQKWEEKEIIFENLPNLTAQSDLNYWHKVVKGIEAPNADHIHIHTLKRNKEIEIAVAWLFDSIPDEHHDNTIESFLILEGSCQCVVGKEIIDLEVGDYLQIPLHVNHNVTKTSVGPLKAIIQWQRFAA